MLDRSHVLDLINNSDTKPKVSKSFSQFVDHERDFKNKKLSDHEGGWVVIDQEHPKVKSHSHISGFDKDDKKAMEIYPKSNPVNYITSFHKSMDDLPFGSLQRHQTVYPVSHELLDSNHFNWSRVPRD